MMQQKKTRSECALFLENDATTEDLQEIFEQLKIIPTFMARSGKNVGHATIQKRFWMWRKGTTCMNIQRYLLNHPRWGK